MTPEMLFGVANPIALVGWIILIFAGRRRWAASLVTGAVIPLLFGVVYSALLLSQWGKLEGGFGTLAEVTALFSNPWALLAGWVHYLAFDLFVGSWEVRDAEAHGISHLAVVPCLVLTFLFGPAGFLLYYAVRFGKTRMIKLSGSFREGEPHVIP